MASAPTSTPLPKEDLAIGLANNIYKIELDLSNKLMQLSYGNNVQYKYDPIRYAEDPHRDYLLKVCRYKPKVMILGMNPGPWGMVQTGVSSVVVRLVMNRPDLRVSMV